MNRNPDLTVDDPTTHIGTLTEADDRDAWLVLTAPQGEDGRSEPLWLTLANGDLALVYFPQGELYERLQAKGVGA